MKSVKFLFFASVCSAVMTAAFQSEAYILPDGYIEVEYVTIPLGSANRNGVATAVAWPDVKKAYVKYATTDTVPIYFMILGGIKDVLDKTPESQWIALSNSGGQDRGMVSSGFSSVSAERTVGDTYARDGSVHEITFTCSTATANLVFFGGCWSDHYWSVAADWYRVKLYGSGEALIASFVPCIHGGVAGFYDTVSQSFLTKQFADWPDFVAGAAVTNYPITVSGSPAMFGTVSPAYGSGTVEKGVSVPLALTDGQDDNGVTYYYNAAQDTRVQFTNCVVSVDEYGAVTNTGTTFNMTFHAPAAVVWNFIGKQYAVSAAAQTGGAVSINGGVAFATTNAWCDAGGTATFAATPSAGYNFFRWEGAGVSGTNFTDNPISLPVNAPFDVKAYFIAVDETHEATNVIWSASVAGAWDEPANWGGAVPGPGDDVTIPASAKVILYGPTPHLNALDVSGTLIVSNWFSRIDASAVTVRAGGKIKAGNDGYMINGMPSNRVWIAGTTLDVQAGGVISADAAGYAGTNGPCWTAEVTRKALDKDNGRNFSPYGGAYGGAPGYEDFRTSWNISWGVAPQPCGSAEWPFAPGSGGGACIRSGGGAVFLDFAGAVTVNGTVSANSSEAPYTGYPSWEALNAQSGEGVWNWVNAPYGSGGGIVIRCRTVAGSGTVSANSGCYTGGRNGGGGGSGGRVAVHYDAAAQAAADCDVRFETLRGVSHGGYGYSGLGQSVRLHGTYAGGPGTLWFTDNQFLESYASTGWKFGGVWCSGTGDPAAFNCAGDLKIDGGLTRFLAPNFTFDVGGDLVITGAHTYAERCGLSFASNVTFRVGGNIKISNAVLEFKRGADVAVKGDFMMESNSDRRKGAMVYLQAAPTNTPASYGASFTVGGKWTIGASGVFLPYCEANNGAIPVLMAKALYIDAAGEINASGKGYKYGPGYYAAARGASYGGIGGGNYVGKAAYGSAEEPVDPGSGDCYQSHGGGVVHLTVENKAEIYGSILADAKDVSTISPDYIPFNSGASGGSVNLRIYKLIGGEAARISALGGGANGATGYNLGDPGKGGGGRIAIRVCQNNSNWEDNAARVSAAALIAGTPTVAPTAGTIWWGGIPAKGLLLKIR